MHVIARETYSNFKKRIPDDYKLKRKPNYGEFRVEVGKQAIRFRDEYLPATNNEKDRHARWLSWIEQITFDENWDFIKEVDDDIVNDLARGQRAGEYAIALYYRFHSILDNHSFADAIDELVFEKPLREYGVAIFDEDQPPKPAEPKHLSHSDTDNTILPRHEARHNNFVAMRNVENAISQLPPHKVDEIYFDQLEFTKACPAKDPLGILLALVSEEKHGLSNTELIADIAKNNVQTQNVTAEFEVFLPELKLPKTGQTGEGFELFFEELKNPAPEFLIQLAINHVELSVLDLMLGEALKERNQLAYAAIRCCMQLVEGTNAALGAYFFGKMAQVSKFSDFTRGMALYLQSIFNNYRGEVELAQYGCKSATKLILSQFGTAGDRYFPLLSKIYAHRAAHIFSLLNPRKLDINRVNQAMRAVHTACTQLGIGEPHFRDVQNFIAEQERSNDPIEKQIYFFTCSLYHLIEAVQCHVNGNDTLNSFQNNMAFNKALSRVNARQACVMLTPMASLANIIGQQEVAFELYGWSNGEHPIVGVNRERFQINNNEKHTSEFTINILSYYNYLNQEFRRGNTKVERRLTETKQALVKHKKSFGYTQIGEVGRYAKRFAANINSNKTDYVASEMIPAGSHHMHIGIWEDNLTDKFKK